MTELKKARDTLSEHSENRSSSLTLDLELSTCSLPGRADADAEWGSPEPWPQTLRELTRAMAPVLTLAPTEMQAALCKDKK